MFREDILKAGRKVTPVEGQKFSIRSLSSKERIAFHESIKGDNAETLETVLSQMAKLCVICICDDAGVLIFNADDWQALLDTDLPLIQIGHQIMEANGFGIDQKKTT